MSEGYPISHIDTSRSLTGSWRTLRPVFQNGIAPCYNGCPNRLDVPGVMTFFREDRLPEALNLIRTKNPMPAVTGRVCPGFCENACNRTELDEPVSVRAIERFIGDWGLEVPMKKEKTDSDISVAVVGSGPAGLAASYFLAMNGIQVDLFEREEQPGGMLRYGIPEYRLPKDILAKEIKNIFELGINFFPNIQVSPDLIPTFLKKYAHVFFSPGLWEVNVPDWGYEGDGLYDGLTLLKRINSGAVPELGHRIAVVGGGNTAFDVARVLSRLGKDVVVIYRRTLDEAPAFREEIDEAIEEKVLVLESKVIAGIESGGDKRLKVEIRHAEMRDGKVLPGGYSGLEVFDSVVSAVGQVAPSRLANEKVILGGDYAGDAATVIHALASGRKGAADILQRSGILIRGDASQSQNLKMSPRDNRIIGYDEIKSFCFEKTSRVKVPKISAIERAIGFMEVNGTPSGMELKSEADRCFSCGNCTACGYCWYFCPDACVVLKIGAFNEIVFNTEYCKGCALCSASCPRGCIIMEGEE